MGKRSKICIIEILKGTERRIKHLRRVLVATGGARTPSERRPGAYEQGSEPPNASRALQAPRSWGGCVHPFAAGTPPTTFT